MKKKRNIMIAAVVGFAIAMILMSIAIFCGYTAAYKTDESIYVVKLAGLSIYELTRSGKDYVGASIGTHMGIVCGICVALSIVIEEIISRVRKAGD